MVKTSVKKSLAPDAIALDSKNQTAFTKAVKNIKKSIAAKEEVTLKYRRGIILVNHLPHGFFEEELTKFFSQFGKVLRVRVGRSQKTGRSRGYAFVEFEFEEVARIAAESMNNYLMFERLIKCELLPEGKCKKASKIFGFSKIREDNYPTLTRRTEIKLAQALPIDAEGLEVKIKSRQKVISKHNMKLTELGISYQYEDDENMSETLPGKKPTFKPAKKAPVAKGKRSPVKVKPVTKSPATQDKKGKKRKSDTPVAEENAGKKKSPAGSAIGSPVTKKQDKKSPAEAVIESSVTKKEDKRKSPAKAVIESPVTGKQDKSPVNVKVEVVKQGKKSPAKAVTGSPVIEEETVKKKSPAKAVIGSPVTQKQDKSPLKVKVEADIESPVTEKAKRKSLAKTKFSPKELRSRKSDLPVVAAEVKSEGKKRKSELAVTLSDAPLALENEGKKKRKSNPDLPVAEGKKKKSLDKSVLMSPLPEVTEKEVTKKSPAKKTKFSPKQLRSRDRKSEVPEVKSEVKKRKSLAKPPLPEVTKKSPAKTKFSPKQLRSRDRHASADVPDLVPADKVSPKKSKRRQTLK